MKRKIALTICLIFLILVTITYYYVSPPQSIDYYESVGNKNLIKILMNLSSVSVKDKSLQAELSEDNINEIIEAIGFHLKYRAEINDDTLDVYVSTKVANLVNTYYKLTFSLSAEYGNTVLKLVGSKLGRLNISNEKVLRNISSSNSNKDIVVESSNNKIIVSNKVLYFNYLEISNDVITLSCDVNKDELEDTIKNGIEDIISSFKQ